MEKTPFRRRIFAESNRTNMLHTISWGEYFTVMSLGLGLYYSWWLVRYYPTLRWDGKGKLGRIWMAIQGWVKRVMEKVLPAREGNPDV
jgi:hypothetical protein